MARATFVKSAQKDIYTHGKNVEYKSEKGKKAGQMKTKLDRTIPQNKQDTVFIAKGESYYWWQFMHGGKHLSKTPPKRSQLTQSGFLSSLYDLEDSIGEFTCDNKEDFDSFKEDILSQIEEMKDQCEESLNNMPDSLQSSPTGELLQERIDNLDSWHSEIESIECDYDEEDIKEEKKGDLKKEEDETEEDYQQRIEEEVGAAISDIVTEAIGEIQSTSAGL